MKAFLGPPIALYDQIPSTFQRPDGNWFENYDKATELHYDDGWRDYVEPSYNPCSDGLDSLIYDNVNDWVTHSVAPLSPSEADAYKESKLEVFREKVDRAYEWGEKICTEDFLKYIKKFYPYFLDALNDPTNNDIATALASLDSLNLAQYKAKIDGKNDLRIHRMERISLYLEYVIDYANSVLCTPQFAIVDALVDDLFTFNDPEDYLNSFVIW